MAQSAHPPNRSVQHTGLRDPAQTDDGAPPGDRISPPTPSAPTVLSVLIVEDLPRVQSLLFDLIHEPGHLEVLAITDTQSQAIEQFEALSPDAVIVDLSLRQGSGLGVIAALRRGHHAKRPLLIVLTNHAMPALKAACMSAGADHYLDKSRDFPKVRALLEQAHAGMLRAE